MRKWALITGLLGALLPLFSACNVVSMMSYFFSPPQVQKAEFKLTDGRLAVLIETAHPEQDNPIFNQALCERLAEIFRNHSVKVQLVPQEEIYRLRQQNRDFAKWSVQKVGRALSAKQVLYVRVEELRFREAPDVPVLAPVVHARLRVVDAAAPEDKAQAWPGPQERAGREAMRARPQRLADDALAVDEEAAKLGKDAAYVVAAPFYDVDLEKKTPWEP